MAKYSDTPEDTMVNRLIRNHKENVGDEDHEMDDVEITPEAHYNHYGTRGVADLYVEEREEASKHITGDLYKTGTFRYVYVYEVKSEHAVKHATGANEIVRQFNKMCDYFFEDESWRKGYQTRLELCFIPTPVTWNHVRENRDIYEELVESSGDTVIDVVFRAPIEEEIYALPAFRSTFDSMDETLEAMRPEFREFVES